MQSTILLASGWYFRKRKFICFFPSGDVQVHLGSGLAVVHDLEEDLEAELVAHPSGFRAGLIAAALLAKRGAQILLVDNGESSTAYRRNGLRLPLTVVGLVCLGAAAALGHAARRIAPRPVIRRLAGATIVIASLVAMRKDNLKARLAYSTISQLSYIVLGAALATSAGVIGGGMHIVMHAVG